MKTPREKYLNDAHYHQLVEAMHAQIDACHFTPSEMREAAVLACILYEERHIRAFSIRMAEIPKEVKTALNVMHEFTTSYESSLYQERPATVGPDPDCIFCYSGMIGYNKHCHIHKHFGTPKEVNHENSKIPV